MRFSERIGVNPPKFELQSDSVDIPLRNSLWSVTHMLFFVNTTEDSVTGYPIYNNKFEKLATLLRFQFFKIPTDELHEYPCDELEFIKNYYHKSKWFEIYDFIEFIWNNTNTDEYRFHCNSVLKRERSAFRFVGDAITKISDDHEITEVESVLSSDGPTAVKEHIKQAVALYANRKAPDFRNSVKEAISAVEATAVFITGNRNATLGQALKIIEADHGLHSALKEGFSKIYGYTSDADGIRHALTEESTVTEANARFMIVSCSAFVNYLLSLTSESV